MVKPTVTQGPDQTPRGAHLPHRQERQPPHTPPSRSPPYQRQCPPAVPSFRDGRSSPNLAQFPAHRGKPSLLNGAVTVTSPVSKMPKSLCRARTLLEGPREKPDRFCLEPQPCPQPWPVWPSAGAVTAGLVTLVDKPRLSLSPSLWRGAYFLSCLIPCKHEEPYFLSCLIPCKHGEQLHKHVLEALCSNV